jgi:hypothetical protein
MFSDNTLFVGQGSASSHTTFLENLKGSDNGVHQTNKLRGLSPRVELYRPSDSSLSAKLVPTFEDREVSRSQRGGFPMAVISVF